MDMALLEIKQENNINENEIKKENQENENLTTILPKKEISLQSGNTNDYLDPVMPMDQTSSNQEELHPFQM